MRNQIPPNTHLAPLVLQLELGRIERIMTHLRHRLMMTTKEGPGQGVSDRLHPLPHQRPDQAKHFGERVGNQLTTNPLWDLKCCKLLGPAFGSQAFFFCSVLAWSIIRVAHNWATSERVMCRYQPVQLLTSY
jgi:hypothetical protein